MLFTGRGSKLTSTRFALCEVRPIRCRKHNVVAAQEHLLRPGRFEEIRGPANALYRVVADIMSVTFFSRPLEVLALDLPCLLWGSAR